MIELPPIKEMLADYDRIEKRIKKIFREYLYAPLLKDLNLSRDIIKNAKESPFLRALREGVLTVSRGTVKGKLTAEISKELKELGAKWDPKLKAFKLLNPPPEIKTAIATSQNRFLETLKRIDDRLAKILPEEITDNLKIADLFDSVLWRADEKLQRSLKNITVSPKLSRENRRKIADEWQLNMDRWIKDFTEKEIVRLRKDVKESLFSGDRRKAIAGAIEKSYGVSSSKAKFLARQETSLLATKFKESRYVAAGINTYRWGCVAGSAKHPVRPWHKALEGRVFRWDSPPITTKPGDVTRRNNPGEDFNCRCFARPLVKFNEK